MRVSMRMDRFFFFFHSHLVQQFAKVFLSVCYKKLINRVSKFVRVFFFFSSLNMFLCAVINLYGDWFFFSIFVHTSIKKKIPFFHVEIRFAEM